MSLQEDGAWLRLCTAGSRFTCDDVCQGLLTLTGVVMRDAATRHEDGHAQGTLGTELQDRKSAFINGDVIIYTNYEISRTNSVMRGRGHYEGIADTLLELVIWIGLHEELL